MNTMTNQMPRFPIRQCEYCYISKADACITDANHHEGRADVCNNCMNAMCNSHGLAKSYIWQRRTFSNFVCHGCICCRICANTGCEAVFNGPFDEEFCADCYRAPTLARKCGNPLCRHVITGTVDAEFCDDCTASLVTIDDNGNFFMEQPDIIYEVDGDNAERRFETYLKALVPVRQMAAAGLLGVYNPNQLGPRPIMTGY